MQLSEVPGILCSLVQKGNEARQTVSVAKGAAKPATSAESAAQGPTRSVLFHNSRLLLSNLGLLTPVACVPVPYFAPGLGTGAVGGGSGDSGSDEHLIPSTAAHPAAANSALQPSIRVLSPNGVLLAHLAKLDSLPERESLSACILYRLPGQTKVLITVLELYRLMCSCVVLIYYW